MGAVQSHNLSVGIVGLPNSGKSTLFNALTKCGVPAENYPFCTIDKNTGVVAMEDARLDSMSDFFKAEKKVPSLLKFVDIAGLVKGASKGEGLGNKFLSHIREVDVILFVLRAFGGESITHVYNRVDPLDDLAIVQSELIIKDIETVQKRLSEREKLAKIGDERAKKECEFLNKVLDQLSNGKAVIEMEQSQEQQEWLYDMFLLTNKPRAYILNRKIGVDDKQYEVWHQKFVDGIAPLEKDYVIGVDVKLIEEMSHMDQTEVDEYISLIDQKPATLDDIIGLVKKRLDLISFYTGSSKECNAWSVKAGSSAVECAGVIHTDLAKSFVTADVVDVQKLLQLGGMAKAKEAGIVKNVGKDYILQDGEYMIVFNS